jgi:hypothetical protein
MGQVLTTVGEMARLIDSIVFECKDQGIETLPQEEIESMKREWAR